MANGGRKKGKNNNKNTKNQNQSSNRKSYQQSQSNKVKTQASEKNTSQIISQENQLLNTKTSSPMKLDNRKFSLEAHEGLTEVKNKLTEELSAKYCGNASNLVRGLTAYISTWGLHRLSGDMRKFLKGTGSDTKYKGIVYQLFLERLQKFSSINFDPNDESTLFKLHFREYTALNRLSIQLAKEWSFWAVAVLGEPKDEKGAENND